MPKCIVVLAAAVLLLLAAVACGAGKAAVDPANAAVISQVAGARPALDAALLRLERADAAMRDGRREKAARDLAAAGLKLKEAGPVDTTGAATGDALRLSADCKAYVQAQTVYLLGLSAWIADASSGADPPSDLRARRVWCEKMKATLDADLAGGT